MLQSHSVANLRELSVGEDPHTRAELITLPHAEQEQKQSDLLISSTKPLFVQCGQFARPGVSHVFSWDVFNTEFGSVRCTSTNPWADVVYEQLYGQRRGDPERVMFIRSFVDCSDTLDLVYLLNATMQHVTRDFVQVVSDNGVSNRLTYFPLVDRFRRTPSISYLGNFVQQAFMLRTFYDNFWPER